MIGNFYWFIFKGFSIKINSRVNFFGPSDTESKRIYKAVKITKDTKADLFS